MVKPDSELLESVDSLPRAVLGSLPGISILVFDTDMVLRLADGGAFRDYGYDPAELVGKRLRDALPGESFNHLIPRYEATLEGKSDEFEVSSFDGRGRFLINVEPLVEDGEIVGGVALAREITARKLVEDELRTVSESFESAFISAPIGMALVGLDGRARRVNKALVNFLGYEPEELAQLTVEEITHPDDFGEDLEQANRLLEGRIERYELEKRYMRKSGESVWALLAVSLVRDEGGTPLYYISQIKDITGRKQAEADLRKVAAEDSLTGVANRRQFESDLAAQVARCRRQMETAALLMLDVDRFKSVNDTFGHAAGDTVLKAIASDLTGRVRTEDKVARVGGDEFALIMVGGDADTAAALAEELMRHFDRLQVDYEGQQIGCRASIGSQVITGDEKDIDEVLLAVDHAMYGAKELRRSTR